MIIYALQSVCYRQHTLTRQIKPVNEAEVKSGGFGGGMSEEMMKEK